MQRFCRCFILCTFLSFGALAQHPFKDATEAVQTRFSDSQPVLWYVVHVDKSDTTGIEVEMHLRNVPGEFRVAMVKHPEYDDQYWQFLGPLRIESGLQTGTAVREDSALWCVKISGSEATIRYRLGLPPSRFARRSAWRPFLTSTGGLIGDVHTFLYVVGQTLAPSTVTLDLPEGWQIATGLESTSDPSTFFAPTAAVLVDCPILVGNLRLWNFKIDGVPHRIVYWPLPSASPFDTSAIVAGIRTIAGQAIALFGRAPYREYSFLLQDGAVGALEHLNSVTLGWPSASLGRNPNAMMEELAHEYVHSWNLMRIRPVEYGDVEYKPQPLSKGLWWSEGMSMFYADLLLRRGGLEASQPTRVAHLENLLARYLGSPGNSTISAERVSLAAYDHPGALGDYGASTHLQGELFGDLLDLVIRDATGGRKSIDDVMRLMFERFSGTKGFVGSDIEKAIQDVSGKDVHRFFDDHIRRGKTIDANRYLNLIGMRYEMQWNTVRDADGNPAPDLRTYAWQPPGDSLLQLVITDPKSCWGLAGLHTGDRILSVRGQSIASLDDFRQLIRGMQVGDSVGVHVKHGTYDVQTTVHVRGWSRAVVRIVEDAGASTKQQMVRSLWMEGK